MIVDRHGNPIKKQDLTTEIAAPTLTGIRTVWDSTVAAGLTPFKLASLLQGAASGDANDYLTLAEEMEERDLHYRCELSKRKLAVASLPVTVESASDDAGDKKLAEEVRALTKRPGFRGLLKDLLDGIGKGYSVCEIIWEPGKKWLPTRYEWRDPRFFTFDRVSRRQVRLLDEADMMEGIELAPFKFLCHVPHLKTGIPIRGGIARVAAWAYLFKNYTVKDWLAFAEVFGMPLRVGKYQPGADKDDIAILKSAVANLGSDAAAVIPESMLIEFVESAKSTGGHELYNKLADWLDAQVSRGILGQTATTTGTPGKLGGDEAQSEVREDIRDDDAVQLAETINRDLVKPFIDLNFGVQERYPELILRAVEKDDLNLLTLALEKLVPLGLKVEQSVVRDKLGLPDPEEGAECLGAPAPLPNQPSTTEPPNQPPPTPSLTKEGALARNSIEQSPKTAGPEVTDHLFSWAREEVMGPASSLIDAAEAMLDTVESLEEFREKLIDLYAQSDPERLAEILARMELLGNMSGRLDVNDESGRI